MTPIHLPYINYDHKLFTQLAFVTAMESSPLTGEHCKERIHSCQEVFCQSCMETLPLQVEVNLVCRICKKVTEAQCSVAAADHSLVFPVSFENSKESCCKMQHEDWPKETLRLSKTPSPARKTDLCHNCSPAKISKNTPQQINLLDVQLEDQKMNLYVTLESVDLPGPVPVSPSKNYEYTYSDTITGYQYPWGVAVSNNGDVAVAEWGGNCITILNSQGRLKASFGYKAKKKTFLQNPSGVHFTRDNHLLVTDSTRVLKFTLKGGLVKKVGSGRGCGQQQFDSAAGLAVHPFNNKIYVADSLNNRIQVLNENMTFSHNFGGKGSQPGKFYLPWDVAFDSNGMVYVVEGNSRIQKFTPEGEFIRSFGKKGSSRGEMDRPAAIVVDQHGYIHISELYNHRISMYNPSGNFICCYGKQGTGTDGFNQPCGIAVTKCGDLYVSDCWNNRLKIFKVPNM